MNETWTRRLLPKTPWGDRIYGLYRFYRKFRRFPEKRPRRFNDNLFALKTSGMGYDPLVQFVTDKEYAKLYFSSVLGSEYTIDTYRILRSVEELENYAPDRFPCVVKPTHSSGQAAICTDPSVSLDRDRLRQWFFIDHYLRSREQNYRHLVPKIIVEEFFSEDGRTVPDDYGSRVWARTPCRIRGAWRRALPALPTMRRSATNRAIEETAADRSPAPHRPRGSGPRGWRWRGTFPSPRYD